MACNVNGKLWPAVTVSGAPASASDTAPPAAVTVKVCVLTTRPVVVSVAVTVCTPDVLKVRAWGKTICPGARAAAPQAAAAPLRFAADVTALIATAQSG